METNLRERHEMPKSDLKSVFGNSAVSIISALPIRVLAHARCLPFSFQSTLYNSFFPLLSSSFLYRHVWSGMKMILFSLFCSCQRRSGFTKIISHSTGQSNVFFFCTSHTHTHTHASERKRVFICSEPIEFFPYRHHAELNSIRFSFFLFSLLYYYYYSVRTHFFRFW